MNVNLAQHNVTSSNFENGAFFAIARATFILVMDDHPFTFY